MPKDKAVVEGESVPETPRGRPEADIRDMPPEGLAAYWLSLKKLQETKRDPTLLLEESRHTPERFVRWLLEAVAGNMAPERLARLGAARKRLILADYRRTFACMRLAAVAVAAGDSPRLTLVRMLSQYPVPPIGEAKATDLAKTMLKALTQGAVQERSEAESLVAVDHKLKADRLLVKLLFLLLLARREGPDEFRARLSQIGGQPLTEGLGLALDNMGAEFVDAHCASVAHEMLADASFKLDLSLEMALGVREGLAYPELYLVAKAFLP